MNVKALGGLAAMGVLAFAGSAQAWYYGYGPYYPAYYAAPVQVAAPVAVAPVVELKPVDKKHTFQHGSKRYIYPAYFSDYFKPGVPFSYGWADPMVVPQPVVVAPYAYGYPYGYVVQPAPKK